MTTKHYEQYVDGLPKASHTMEHITNFGKIVSRGFVLLATTFDRSNQRLVDSLVDALGGDAASAEAIRARRAAERKAKEQALRDQLAALEAESDREATEDTAA